METFGRVTLTHTYQRMAVRQLIMSCNECGLGTANRVPYNGPTSDPDLILVGEAPGANEDRAGIPFVGRAGKLLDELLERAGSSRTKSTAVNTVCCRPPSNRDPSWDEVQACKPNFTAQLKLSQANVGVVLGRIAMSILSEDPKVSIGATRSIPVIKYRKVWIPTYHPAYALRNPQAKDWIVADLKLAMTYLNFAKAIVTVDETIGAEVIG